MPLRNDIEKILLIGAGPNIIGQGSEFDYFAKQALIAYKALGIDTVIVNSNSSTISTDVDLATVTYIEPLDLSHLNAIIERENPTAVLATLGGQKALNLSSELSKSGILERNDCKIIGAAIDDIELSESRIAFKKKMLELGIDMARSQSASTVDEAEAIAKFLGYPVVVRPAFTTGGVGGGLVYNINELRDIASRGISASMVRNVLIEEAVLGWKEFEVETLSDINANVIVAGVVENVDPMGVHTGDSMSVMPAQTVTKDVIDRLKATAIKIVQAMSASGAVNVQFAYNPVTDQIVVIEVNLRATRTTSLIARATGLAMGDIVARLSVGYLLEEIIVPETNKSILDYNMQFDGVIVRIPYWSMEKFEDSVDILGTQMKSIGEVIGIGNSYIEAVNKAEQALERWDYDRLDNYSLADIYSLLRAPSSKRYDNIYQALKKGASIDTLIEYTDIDRHYLAQIAKIVDMEKRLVSCKLTKELLYEAKQSIFFSDGFIGGLIGKTESDIKALRDKWNIKPVIKQVSINGGLYRTYNGKSMYKPSSGKKILLLGSGAHRIGQGNEFDYCLAHAVGAIKEMGYQPIVISANSVANCNDIYDGVVTYYEPVTIESITDIIDIEKPEGVIACFGGQNAYSLISKLEKQGVNIYGLNSDKIAITENKTKLRELLKGIDIRIAQGAVATNSQEAEAIAEKIGYPVLVRPSYMIGGKGMCIIHESEGLANYMNKDSRPYEVYIEEFLHDAIEIEIDAVCSGDKILIPEFMEHIEYAGVHSGDSDCVIPTPIPNKSKIIEIVEQIAKRIDIKGIINIKLAIKEDELYLLETRLRSSRSVSLITKVTNIDLANIATKVILSSDKESHRILDNVKMKQLDYYATKAAVFPFEMFRDVFPSLGPEMRSTGSVLCFAETVGESFYKAQIATDVPIPIVGKVLVSVDDSKKEGLGKVVGKFVDLGFELIATGGTYRYLKDKGIKVKKVDKIFEGRPNIADIMINGDIDLIINTPSGRKSEYDDSYIRRIAIKQKICYITTIEAVEAVLNGIKSRKSGAIVVRPINSYYR